MAFGSLVPGMAPMPIPQMGPSPAEQGMRLLQMAQQQQRQAQQQPAGQPPQGLLQRLLNPAAPATPAAGQSMDLAAPGMPPNAPAAPMNPAQMGLLSRLFPGLIGQQPAQQPAMAPTPPPNAIPVPPDPNGGLY